MRRRQRWWVKVREFPWTLKMLKRATRIELAFSAWESREWIVDAA
jgi:hypothetical protein